jgi:hypothetical protein
MGTVVNYLAMIRAPTLKFLPSFWITQAVAFATHKDLVGYIQFFSILLSIAIALLLTSLLLASRTYYSNWLTAQEGISQTRKTDRIGKATRLLFKSFPRQIRALVEKDTKLFFRDTGQ